jgi:4-hydroxythreonine-4-phosphate dehydrogenase
MMLVGGPLRVALATIHVPLAKVPRLLSAKRIAEVIELSDDACKRLGIARPRIGVAGLNPHAGEGGLLGDEERRIIAPAIRRAAGKKIDVTGPWPADTLFHKAYHGEFDAVVAMYHDQGLAPLKMIAFDTGVNLTLGLPFVRTSPDHGTAFDIAGKGIAKPDSLIAAINLAAELSETRKVRRNQ